MELKINDTLRTVQGQTVTVRELIGSGGQGNVYKVDYAGVPKALKLYHEKTLSRMEKRGSLKGFHDNLVSNIRAKSPAKQFIWPEDITEWNGSAESPFGYIMDLRPEGYTGLTEIFGIYGKGETPFPDYNTMFRAAINIIEGFRTLHNHGYSYQDINDGSFFINCKTGDVLICDNDNVSVNSTNFGISGKMRYMAPEIVLGGTPDKFSDRFSLAVILFRLLFRRQHPLEGKYSMAPCMTPEYEKLYYGSQPLFLFDPDDNRNAPEAYLGQSAVMTLWPRYPAVIRNLFIQTFGKTGVRSPDKRPVDITWLKAFTQLDACTINCPGCGRTVFLDPDSSVQCSKCGKQLRAPFNLLCGSFEIPVVPGTEITNYVVDPTSADCAGIYMRVVKQPDGQVVFVNCSNDSWTVHYQDGRSETTEKNETAVILQGMKLIAHGNVIELKRC